MKNFTVFISFLLAIFLAYLYNTIENTIRVGSYSALTNNLNELVLLHSTQSLIIALLVIALFLPSITKGIKPFNLKRFSLYTLIALIPIALQVIYIQQPQIQSLSIAISQTMLPTLFFQPLSGIILAVGFIRSIERYS